MTVSEKKLVTVGEWLVTADPVRTETVLCRTADKSLINQYFSRHRVAALSAEAVEQFQRIARQAIAYSHPTLLDGNAKLDNPIVQRARNRFSAGIEILGRVAVRLGTQDCAELWRLAMELYRSRAVTHGIGESGPLSQLLKSLILTTPGETLAEKLPEIMALPIPGSKAFPVIHREAWPELATQVKERLPTLTSGERPAAWAPTISMLLDAAEERDEFIRGRALARLSVLNSCNYMNASENRRLAKIYWSKIDEATNLPDVSTLWNFSSLSMPETKKGQAATLFRKYATTSQLPDLSPGAVNQNALLIDWLNAAHDESDEEAKDGRGRLRFGHSEVLTMLDRIASWWERSGKAELAKRREQPSEYHVLAEGELIDRLEYVLDVLRVIVGPKITPRSDVARRVLVLIRDMSTEEVPISSLAPILSRLSGDQDAILNVKRDLASGERERNLSAIRGITNWFLYAASQRSSSRERRVVGAPQELLYELCQIIAWRRQPGLLSALDGMGKIIAKVPETIGEKCKQALLIGLDYLRVEAAYRITDKGGHSIAYEDVPMCRVKAAKVAGLLRRLYDKPQSILESWVQAAQSDPLPEVRHAVCT